MNKCKKKAGIVRDKVRAHFAARVASLDSKNPEQLLKEVEKLRDKAFAIQYCDADTKELWQQHYRAHLAFMDCIMFHLSDAPMKFFGCFEQIKEFAPECADKVGTTADALESFQEWADNLYREGGVLDSIVENIT